MKKLAIVAAVYVAGLASCGAVVALRPSPQASPASPHDVFDSVDEKVRAARRFELVTTGPLGSTAGLALETNTGRLCKTWAWDFDNENATTTLRLMSKLPTCESLR